MTLLKRPAFLRDLNHYAAYIAKDNPDAARRLLIAAEAACEDLVRQPEMGHLPVTCRIWMERKFHFATQNHGIGITQRR